MIQGSYETEIVASKKHRFILGTYRNGPASLSETTFKSELMFSSTVLKLNDLLIFT